MKVILTKKRPMLLAIVCGILTIIFVAGFMANNKSSVQVDRLDIKQVKNLTRSLKVVSITPLASNNAGLTLTLKNASKREITQLAIQALEEFSIYDLMIHMLKPGETAKYDFFIPGSASGKLPPTLQSSNLKIVVTLLKGNIIDGSLKMGNRLVEERLGQLEELKKMSAVLAEALTMTRQDESVKRMQEKIPIVVGTNGAIQVNSDRERGAVQMRQMVLRMLSERGATNPSVSTEQHRSAVKGVRDFITETIKRKEKL